ncbi:MAG TPA: SMR family transporter [Gammaproteobacteria bacterium]|nr:SMR family transporter [Gammaproteobacteria bacterium]
MSITAFLLILAGVLLNAFAQFLLKAGVNRMGAIGLNWSALVQAGWHLALEPYIYGGLGCYVISVVVWILALSRVPVSMAYPMLSIGYVVTAVAAWAFLGETVTPLRLVGIGIIIVGVFIVARS